MLVKDEAVLRTVSEPVSVEEGEKIAGLLIGELSKHPTGIGLSAIQIGLSKRVFVLKDGGGFISFINPEIIDSYDPVIASEGCLSFPEQFVTTQRHGYVVVRDWERDRVLMGTMAVAAQHEMDHLQGILFFDRKFEGIRKEAVAGRNDPCPCGSGKKFKKCCDLNK